MTQVKALTDLPASGQGEFYAIVKIGSVYIPGDERSRSAPGHGYPGSNLTYPELQVFTHRGEWERTIETLMSKAYTNFRAFKMTPVTVTKTIEIS